MPSGESIIRNSSVSRIRLYINTFILLESVAIPIFVACTVLAAVVYWNRRVEIAPWFVPLAVVIAVGVLLVWAWKASVSRLFSRRDTLALIDESLGLNAALSAEAEWGIRTHRDGMPSHSSMLNVKAAPALGWLVGGAVMLLAGWIMPLPDGREALPKYSEKSPALAQVEEWMEKLDEMEEIAPESTEELKKDLEELQKMNGEEMYSHAGLEAADAMASRASAAMNEMASSLSSVEAAIQQSMQGGDSASALQNLKEALKGMEQGTLRPSGDLAARMESMANAGMGSLTPDQLRKLANQLRNAANQMNDMCNNPGSGMSPVANPGDFPSLGDGQCDGKDGDGWGRGGISRGRGDAPLAFGDSNQQLKDGSQQGVSNTDMSHAALGSMTGTESSAPTMDENPEAVGRNGGRAATPAKGGDSIWKDDLDPSEREAMRSFFK